MIAHLRSTIFIPCSPIGPPAGFAFQSQIGAVRHSRQRVAGRLPRSACLTSRPRGPISAVMSDPAPFDLDTRTGWPDELRLFLDRFPRTAWPPRRRNRRGGEVLARHPRRLPRLCRQARCGDRRVPRTEGDAGPFPHVVRPAPRHVPVASQRPPPDRGPPVFPALRRRRSAAEARLRRSRERPRRHPRGDGPAGRDRQRLSRRRPGRCRQAALRR